LIVRTNNMRGHYSLPFWVPACAGMTDLFVRKNAGSRA
jgi:hypothetical protein